MTIYHLYVYAKAAVQLAFACSLEDASSSESFQYRSTKHCQIADRHTLNYELLPEFGGNSKIGLSARETQKFEANKLGFVAQPNLQATPN
ncbi:hypothetical protein [Microseira wollei]|uniref:hypothetical protein n=1 Tax=Microseira wollei TaxID=467598 RepID=UPI001CFD8B83|nr:hypothetical protein [Microseira wollei]